MCARLLMPNSAIGVLFLLFLLLLLFSLPSRGDASAGEVEKLRRVSASVYVKDWNRDGKKDGLTWGVIFKDHRERSIRFNKVRGKVSVKLFSRDREGRKARLLYSKEGITFDSSRDLNALFPRNPWQRIPWKAISANPNKDSRRGRLEIEVLFPRLGSFTDSESFLTALYPKRLETQKSPKVNPLAQERGKERHSGKLPGLKRVALYANARDWSDDGIQDGLLWWLSFRDGDDESLRFEELEVSVDLALYTKERDERGRRVFIQKGIRGKSHKDFQCISARRLQRIPWEKIEAQRTKDERYGIAEAIIKVEGYPNSFLAVENFLTVLYPKKREDKKRGKRYLLEKE